VFAPYSSAGSAVVGEVEGEVVGVVVSHFTTVAELNVDGRREESLEIERERSPNRLSKYFIFQV